MSEIEVRLLGNPEVLWRGKAHTIERRNTRLLLYFLTSQDGLVNRFRLADLFWGQIDERSARTNLRQTLHRLRASFPGVQLLKEQGELIGADFEVIDVNLHQFLRNFEQVFPLANRIPPSQLLPTEILQKLLYLDGLWHGTTFLGESVTPDSLALDEWINSTNERLQPLRQWVLERLADHAAAANNLGEALSFVNRALVNHETDESLQKRALKMLLRMNRHTEAQEKYKKYLRDLAKEKLTPSTEFRQQFDSLIYPSTRPRGVSQVAWNLYEGIEMPFVGRRNELDALNQQYQAGGAVYIFGESGQGKTRLLATFASQVFPMPRTILAQARAGEISLPYQPLVDALRQGVQPSEWLRLPGVWASHLAQLLPELSALRSDLKQQIYISPEQARAQLQEALRQLFLLVAQHQQLLLVLDDAQWSDEATLSALEYLISRQPFDKRALLVIAARTEEPNPSLEKLHAHMIRAHSVRTINLDPMKTEDITQLAQSILRMKPSSKLVNRLERDSGGNPLYIGEILGSLATRNATELEVDQLPTSENLAKLIQTRLSFLPHKTLRVLEAAAVLGNEFSLVELSGTSQYPPEELSVALNELVGRHLLRIDPSQNEIHQVRINFIHDKFREVQLLMISPVHLPLLHLQAAKTIYANARENLEESSAVIAQHYEQAGDSFQAFHFWVRAGKRALELFSITEADLAFNRALAAIPHCGSQIDDTTIFHLFLIWRDAHNSRNSTGVLKALGEKQLILGKKRNSPLLLCSGQQTLADAAFTENDFKTGLEQISLAMKDINTLDNRDAVSGVLLTYGVLLLMSGQLQASKAALSRALANLGDLSGADPVTLHKAGDINYELGVVETLSGWPENGRTYTQRSLELHKKIQDQRMALPSIVLAVSLNGLIAHYLGRYAEGAQVCRDMLEPAIQAGAWRAIGYLHDYIALNELAMGNMDEMFYHVEQAIQIGEQLARKEVYTFARRVLGDGLLWMQDFSAAYQYVGLALEQNQDTFLTPDLQIHLGFCEIALGNLEAGWQRITEAEKVCENFGLDFFKEDANMAFFYYYANTGNWQVCKERAKQCILSSGERSLNSTRIFAEHFLALSLIQTGEVDQGMQLLEQVTQIAKGTQNFWAELLALQSMALFLKTTGLEPAGVVDRIMALLAHLDAHTQNQIFRQRYLALRTNILQKLDIPGLISPLIND